MAIQSDIGPIVDLRRSGDALHFRASSQTDSLARAVDLCREFLADSGVADCSAPAVVFRELIVNAMVHGNRASVSRFVTVDLERIGQGNFRFAVQDEGPGFNPDCIETEPSLDGQGRIRRKGYVLVTALTEKVEFQEGSSRVTVTFLAQ